MNKSTAWNFYLDHVSQWSYASNAFTKDECKQIVQEGLKNKLQFSTVGYKNKSVDEEIRKSKIAWITPTIENSWVFRRLTDVILDLNSKFFKFDLFGISEPLQFTEYESNNGFYGKHIDNQNGVVIRKLSVSVQLTDPAEYTGGDLVLYFDAKGTKLEKEQGTLLMFPSYTLHEVKPVLTGTRHSLVAWVTGKSFI